MSSGAMGSGLNFRTERCVNMASPRGLVNRSAFMRWFPHRSVSRETLSMPSLR